MPICIHVYVHMCRLLRASLLISSTVRRQIVKQPAEGVGVMQNTTIKPANNEQRQSSAIVVPHSVATNYTKEATHDVTFNCKLLA